MSLCKRRTPFEMHSSFCPMVLPASPRTCSSATCRSSLQRSGRSCVLMTAQSHSTDPLPSLGPTDSGSWNSASLSAQTTRT